MDCSFAAPFPWFGGKSQVASIVWDRFGDVPNYVEPFFGSGAVLLGRPWPHDGIETVNDRDSLVANAWRAIRYAPDEVATHCSIPVLESELHATHVWLLNQLDTLRAKLEADIDYYDAKIAGRWLWGMACWIGGEFCSGKGPWKVVEMPDGSKQLVDGGGNAGQGINRKRIHLGNAGRGVSRQRVHLGDAGRGINRKRVHLSDAGQGVNRQRVHLGDAGRGEAGTGAAGILAWMQALANRLARVRVCSGDWTRVCGGRGGDALRHMVQRTPCGVFLDPPYGGGIGRNESIYRVEDLDVAADVRAWALRYGDDPRFRITYCGYDQEGADLDAAGWTVVEWKTGNGMGNLGNGKGKANAHRERIWFSPHCLTPDDGISLFDGLEV